MNNLFSIFDPARILGLRLNWSSTLILLITFMPIKFWLANNQRTEIFKLVSKYLSLEIKIVLGAVTAPGIRHFILLLFWFILIIILELAVAIIQSYVFSTLSSLYIRDVNSLNTAV